MQNLCLNFLCDWWEGSQEYQQGYEQGNEQGRQQWHLQGTSLCPHCIASLGYEIFTQSWKHLCNMHMLKILLANNIMNRKASTKIIYLFPTVILPPLARPMLMFALWPFWLIHWISLGLSIERAANKNENDGGIFLFIILQCGLILHLMAVLQGMQGIRCIGSKKGPIFPISLEAAFHIVAAWWYGFMGPCLIDPL